MKNDAELNYLSIWVFIHNYFKYVLLCKHPLPLSLQLNYPLDYGGPV